MRRIVPFVLAALLLVPVAVAATTRTVEIKNSAYAPNPFSANVGDTVRWTNKDNFAHTVTCDAGSCAFASTSFYLFESFSTTLIASGTLRYHCNVHAGMNGALFVGTSAAASPDFAPNASTLVASRPLIAGAVPDPTRVVLTIRVDNPGGSPTSPTEARAILADAQGGSTQVGVTQIPTIPAGGSLVISIEWLNAPLIGASRVAIVVDPENTLVESDEVNNIAVADVRVGLLPQI